MSARWVLILTLISCVGILQIQALTPGRFQFGQASYRTKKEFGTSYITVKRNLGAEGRAAVYVSTLQGSAIAEKDYKGIYNRSLTWQDGDDSEREIYVKIIDDMQPLDVEKTFSLYLHDATGALINPDRSTAQIVISPPSYLFPGTFRFNTSALPVDENPTPGAILKIPVLWEGGTTAKAQVSYEVICESACAPVDFKIESGPKLEWKRGESIVQYLLVSIPEDKVYEHAESFKIRLVTIEPTEDEKDAGVSYGKLGDIPEIQVVIQGPNDVVAGSFQFDAECFPACASKKHIVYDGGIVRGYIQRRKGSDGAAKVSFYTVDDTAIAGKDYVATSGTVQWADGDQSDKEFYVQVLPNAIRQTNRRIKLFLRDPKGGILSEAHASTAYIDIQGPSNVDSGEVNFAADALLNAVLRHPDISFLPDINIYDSGLRQCPRIVIRSASKVSILVRRRAKKNLALANAGASVRTIDNTAISGIDFTALTPNPQTLTWNIGDVSDKAITLEILKHNEYSTSKRTFWLELMSTTGVTMGQCNLIEVVLEPSVSEPPRITSFDLDMNQGQMTLQLSHPVLAITLDASKISLQSEKNQSRLTETFSFSKTTTTSSPDGKSIILTIAIPELRALKRFKSLAKGGTSTFLSTQQGVFDYVLDNCVSTQMVSCAHAPLSSISPTGALSVTTFTLDSIPPVLLSFTLDFDTKLLKLRFSEPIDRSTVNVEAIGLSDSNMGMDFYYLRASSSRLFSPLPDPMSGVIYEDQGKLPVDGTYVTILLGDADITAIKGTGNGKIGDLRAFTFLMISSRFANDHAIPPNAIQAIEPPNLLLQVTNADCSACPAGQYLLSSCSDFKDRVCKACTVCSTNFFALQSCTALRDTVCYPCTECHGGQYASTQCTPTTDRVCSSCTKCTADEYESSPCYNGVDRICRTCDSCSLTTDQQQLCRNSFKWKRKQMKAPYGCPLVDQQYQTLEERLQRAKSNRCGAGRCSCTGNGVGNANPNGNSFPDDRRCTGPEAYNIFI